MKMYFFFLLDGFELYSIFRLVICPMFITYFVLPIPDLPIPMDAGVLQRIKTEHKIFHMFFLTIVWIEALVTVVIVFVAGSSSDPMNFLEAFFSFKFGGWFLMMFVELIVGHGFNLYCAGWIQGRHERNRSGGYEAI